MRMWVLVGLFLLGGCVEVPQAREDAAAAAVRFEAIRFETELGPFTAILFCDETPRTCEFMRGLVEAGYYDGRAFGRIHPGFVIQEVDRTGGTTDQPERVEAEFGTNVTFSAGAIGIARDADPDSGGSEFFVMDHPGHYLWGNFTAFAQVVDGMDVVHAIARVPAARTGPVGGVVASPPGSPLYFGVHDRVPIDPVEMSRVSWAEVELPADVARQYPLLASDTVRTDTLRASLEWPRDLEVGRASMLTWYAWGRDAGQTGQLQDPPALDYGAFDVLVGGEAVGERTLDEVNGKIAFLWTPAEEGLHEIELAQDGRVVALANVTVPIR